MEAKSVIKDYKAETWDKFVQTFRRAEATAEAFSGHMAHSDPCCFEHPRTAQLAEEMAWVAEGGPDRMKPGQRPRVSELGTRLTIELYRQIVKQLPNGKAAGPDAVPNEILKAMPEEFHESLMRAMWKAGITPDTWKLDTFIYLHKKGDTPVLSNYRPIGLLRTILKLCTSLITELLSTFCEVNSIHSQEQMGSRRCRSTINQLLRLQHAIEDSKLSHSQLHVLYVDFENAYGSVEHDKLQHTMTYLGIPEDAVKVVADLYGGETLGSPFKMASKIEHHTFEPLIHHFTDKDRQIRTSFAAYVDDLALVTETAAQLATHVRKLELYSNWSGLRVNKAKCAGLKSG
ncbi:hypothetical protein CYMTET_33356 [Cymbomonas tetramitiformis]|uniref:Reverse transcriptase domain-containing protein n=1 Tax=Cymbomonas tetramitiformis TaxID=36881 RepID=A0AAE0FDE4_9CHLO|nr:hypothetical protein CYMTET_33356 [Cymbomonas tetramitiformis]